LPLVFFDPQFRALLDRQSYGNEGRSRQCRRANLPAMSEEYIDACCREIARVLTPSGYCMRWAETFAVCEGHHLRVKDVLPCVDKIVWDNLRMGMGHRSRHRGDELLILQLPPLRAKHTWRDHGIPNRWLEKIEPAARRKHPHIKPIGLIKRLIGAVTLPGDLAVDPCAGSFVVLDACRQLGRRFIGCDLAYVDAPSGAGNPAEDDGECPMLTPAGRMSIADLVADLDGAHDVILDLIETAEDYGQRADDALNAVAKAADYLHNLKYGDPA
jgi:site-specific DNA-methyltransferase (adenine-specific)